MIVQKRRRLVLGGRHEGQRVKGGVVFERDLEHGKIHDGIGLQPDRILHLHGLDHVSFGAEPPLLVDERRQERFELFGAAMLGHGGHQEVLQAFGDRQHGVRPVVRVAVEGLESAAAHLVSLHVVFGHKLEPVKMMGADDEVVVVRTERRERGLAEELDRREAVQVVSGGDEGRLGEAGEIGHDQDALVPMLSHKREDGLVLDGQEFEVAPAEHGFVLLAD